MNRFLTQLFLIFFCATSSCLAMPSFFHGNSDSSFVSSLEQRMVKFVHQSVDTLRYTAYKLGGTRFDPSRGVYVLDCSTYVDNILQNVSPDAYSSLVDSTGSEKPTSEHYYHFFNQLSAESNDSWNKVDHVEQLKAGDILVFRYKNSRGRDTGGHVMVVMDKPVREDDAFMVKVADSAPRGHSEDTREPHKSGIGIGTLLLKANPKTGHPLAYAWRVGACWKKNVRFAMGRPIETTN